MGAVHKSFQICQSPDLIMVLQTNNYWLSSTTLFSYTLIKSDQQDLLNHPHLMTMYPTLSLSSVTSFVVLQHKEFSHKAVIIWDQIHG